MKTLFVMILILSFSTFSLANESDFKIEFGLVLHNEYGDPIGFKETKLIPIQPSGKESLYGLVISRKNSEVFTLGSVHILPKNPNNWKKIMGKNMKVENKGAVFMKTTEEDPAGEYQMEVYIDGILFEVIKYELVTAI